jgi:hypothetical protein
MFTAPVLAGWGLLQITHGGRSLTFSNAIFN